MEMNMRLEYVSFVACFGMFICFSEAVSTERPLTGILSSMNSSESSAPDANREDPHPLSVQILLQNRSVHSRMRDLEEITTPEGDYWWFLSTPRTPLLSSRDFPGKPGVGSWKEISAGVSSDARKNLKETEPTAAGVSSSATKWLPSSLVVCLSAVFVRQRHFRWT